MDEVIVRSVIAMVSLKLSVSSFLDVSQIAFIKQKYDQQCFPDQLNEIPGLEQAHLTYCYLVSVREANILELDK